jgi:hypothetical protein
MINSLPRIINSLTAKYAKVAKKTLKLGGLAVLFLHLCGGERFAFEVCVMTND